MIEAFASVSDAIFVADVHGVISFINPKAALLSGWDAGEAIGQPVGSVVKFSIDDDLQTVLSSSPYAPSESPQEFTGRISLVKKDGISKSPVKGRAVPFSDEKGNRLGTIILLGDATIEHRLIQAKEILLYSKRKKFFQESISLKGKRLGFQSLKVIILTNWDIVLLI